MRLIYIILISLALSLGAAIGMHCRSVSILREQQQQERRPRSLFLQPLWLVGTLILLMDAIGDFVFIGFIPQSILAPLGALSLCWNTILSPCFQPDERISPVSICAVIVIYAGTLFTISFAGNASPEYDLEDIVSFFAEKRFRIYIVCCASFLLALALHGYCVSRVSFRMFHYCGLAGCLGAQSLTFAKITSELVRHAVMDGKMEYWKNSALPYLFLLTMIILLMIQSQILNSGLATKVDLLVMIPVYQAFWNVFASIGGLIFFEEYRYMNLPLDSIMYVVGFIITLCGIALLVKQQSFHSSNNIRVDLDELEMASLHDGSVDASMTSEISVSTRTGVIA
mmetsp:Transcript_18395/g.27911  ORF Transcript_18395/g.27911 Transcript_18395/m.27911 type:complete len:340 (-) Transcript_18395:314-1333(-)